jgi:hypothetical protein
MAEKTTGLAVKIAEGIERRRFMRRAAQTAFFLAAGVTVGGGLDLFGASKAYANPCGKKSNVPGLGCPKGGATSVYGYAPCGPSPCCDYYGSGPCNCANASHPGLCLSSGRCAGDGYYYANSNCWTCGVNIQGNEWLTTCCDCEYKDKYKTDCKPSKGYYAGRCISWYVAEM